MPLERIPDPQYACVHERPMKIKEFDRFRRSLLKQLQTPPGDPTKNAKTTKMPPPQQIAAGEHAFELVGHHLRSQLHAQTRNSSRLAAHTNADATNADATNDNSNATTTNAKSGGGGDGGDGDGGSARLVRGFLVYVVGNPTPTSLNFAAHAYCVIDQTNPNHHHHHHHHHHRLKAVTKFPRGADACVFLPSKRMHTELNDADLLSNLFELGIVYGSAVSNSIDNNDDGDGTAAVPKNEAFPRFVLRCYAFHGSKSRLYGAYPEKCVAQVRKRVILFPFFEDWLQRKRFTKCVDDIDENLDQLAEAFGYLAISIQNSESLTMGEIEQMLCKKQQKALVDPVLSLQFQKVLAKAAFETSISENEVVRMYHKHYDLMLNDVLYWRRHLLRTTYPRMITKYEQLL
jgi:hypothetical protein